MNQTTDAPSEPARMLTITEVIARTSLGRTTIWRGMRDGLFPRSVNLAGSNRRAWRESDVTAWIQTQKP